MGSHCTPLHTNMSRYPSAYGHTPSYKSVGGLSSSSSSSSYPSALGASSSSSLSRDMDRELGAMKREINKDFGVLSSVSSLGQDPLLKHSSRGGVESSSSYQSKSYSSSSSVGGGQGLPHHSSQTQSPGAPGLGQGTSPTPPTATPPLPLTPTGPTGTTSRPSHTTSEHPQL